MTEEKEIKKVTTRWWNKLILKKTSIDEEVGFNFYLSDLKWVGVVFALSSVFYHF